MIYDVVKLVNGKEVKFTVLASSREALNQLFRSSMWCDFEVVDAYESDISIPDGAEIMDIDIYKTI